jgi:hypothetical protein
MEDLVLLGTSRRSAITPNSDPANSSVARNDKEGPIPFRWILGLVFPSQGDGGAGLSDFASIPVP